MGVFEQCVIFQRSKNSDMMGINVGFVEGLWGNDLVCRDSTNRTMDVKQGNTALRRVWVFYNCVLGD